MFDILDALSDSPFFLVNLHINHKLDFPFSIVLVWDIEMEIFEWSALLYMGFEGVLINRGFANLAFECIERIYKLVVFQLVGNSFIILQLVFVVFFHHGIVHILRSF